MHKYPLEVLDTLGDYNLTVQGTIEFNNSHLVASSVMNLCVESSRNVVCHILPTQTLMIQAKSQGQSLTAEPTPTTEPWRAETCV